jgi:DNA polymerase elongation subunit (family B)
MPAIVEKMYDERVQYKKNMIQCKKKYEENPTPELEKEISKWSNFQMVKKICLNSLYGALGNQYFRHFRIDNAEAITMSGQVVIQWIERKLNEFLNKTLNTNDKDYVIALDTDSVYLNLGPLVDSSGIRKDVPLDQIIDALDKLCEKQIVPYIDKSYQEYADYVNCFENTLAMKRECIAEKGIWTAKKRYILNVCDNEGVRYKEPKLKMMGIESVRSSTPAICRQYITDALKIVMSGTEEELIEFIESGRVDFYSRTPYEMGISSSANNIVKYTGTTTLCMPSTPIAVRAALIYNKMIKDKGLTHKYSLIQDGDKIKYVHLQIPNKAGQNVFGFLGTWPEELGLTPSLDHATMYDKSFITPMKAILNIIGWKTEKTNTLARFFT